MIYPIASPQVIIARMTLILFDLKLGASDLANYSYFIGFTSASQNAFLNALYVSTVGAYPIANVAAKVVRGLGIPSSDTNAYNTALTCVKVLLDASVTSGTQGQTINNIISIFSTMTTDTTFGNYATIFNNQISNVVTYPPSSTCNR